MSIGDLQHSFESINDDAVNNDHVFSNEELDSVIGDSEVEATIDILQGVVAGLEAAVAGFTATDKEDVKAAYQMAADNAVSVLGIESIEIEGPIVFATEAKDEEKPDNKVMAVIKKAWDKIVAFAKKVSKAVTEFINGLIQNRRGLVKRLEAIKPETFKDVKVSMPDMDAKQIPLVGNLSKSIERFNGKIKKTMEAVVTSWLGEKDEISAVTLDIKRTEAALDTIFKGAAAESTVYNRNGLQYTYTTLEGKLSADFKLSVRDGRLEGFSSKVDIQPVAMKEMDMKASDLKSIHAEVLRAAKDIKEQDKGITSMFKEIISKSSSELWKDSIRMTSDIIDKELRGAKLSEKFRTGFTNLINNAIRIHYGLFIRVSNQTARVRGAEFKILKQYVEALEAAEKASKDA